MTVGETVTSARSRLLDIPAAGPSVGVLGHVGNRNLGDEAIIEALIARIRLEWPRARIVAFSMDPTDSARRHAVQAYPVRQEGGRLDVARRAAEAADALRAGKSINSEVRPPPVARLLERFAALFPKSRLRSALGTGLRRAAYLANEIGFLARSFWRIRNLDAMIIAGSNQFLDNFGGPWGYPYTLLKWVILCRLAGCRAFCLSVGAGPLEDPLSHRLARLALRLSNYASFRDHGSHALIAHIAAAPVGSTAPDLAHGLAWPATEAAGNSARLTVAINPMPLYDVRFWPIADAERYRAFVRQLASFTQQVLRDGHHALFFTSHFADARVALDVTEVLRQEAPELTDRLPAIHFPTTVTELMKVVSSASVVVATRFHGILLSFLARRPVVGICYHGKARELMRKYGQERYAVDIDQMIEGDLIARLRQLAPRRAEETDAIRKCNAQLLAQLEAQYRVVFGEIARRTSR